ncbi:hypothetical protein CXP39_01365 [Mesoplasma syrphidae]|uniref:Uncharacterized protein n=1 Tax=Mesoplasma syrphidae TaxID=225999 RepID=A0A2K9BJE8_9MOLU|nr:hypothetical protein [Mesoplasma syrphidae]AUF83451.1 hypothetical protein CXP39_01365 [Mesoplasma syrphidae]
MIKLLVLISGTGVIAAPIAPMVSLNTIQKLDSTSASDTSFSLNPQVQLFTRETIAKSSRFVGSGVETSTSVKDEPTSINLNWLIGNKSVTVGTYDAIIIMDQETISQSAQSVLLTRVDIENNSEVKWVGSIKNKNEDGKLISAFDLNLKFYFAENGRAMLRTELTHTAVDAKDNYNASTKEHGINLFFKGKAINFFKEQNNNSVDQSFGETIIREWNIDASNSLVVVDKSLKSSSRVSGLSGTLLSIPKNIEKVTRVSYEGNLKSAVVANPVNWSIIYSSFNLFKNETASTATHMVFDSEFRSAYNTPESGEVSSLLKMQLIIDLDYSKNYTKFTPLAIIELDNSKTNPASNSWLETTYVFDKVKLWVN